MYYNDVGKDGVQAYEAHEVKGHSKREVHPFILLHLHPFHGQDYLTNGYLLQTS